MRFLRLLVASIALVAATPASAQLWLWSQTPATNANIDPSVNWQEGMPPSAVNDSSRAEMSIIAKYRDDSTGLVVTGGTSTAYTLTTNSGTNGGLNSSLVAGYRTCFTVNVLPGTPVTLAIDGQTAKPLRRAPATELVGGDMFVGVPYCVTYFTSNGGEYILNSLFAISQVGTAQILNGAVTYAKIQNETNNTMLGNFSGGAAPPQELNATQVTAFLNVFSSSLKGLTPSSGGGTINFLRADGTWATPIGAGPGGSNGQVQWNNAGAFGGFTMSGDATLVTSTGVITIGNQAVTYAKIQNVASNNVVLGNISGGAASIAELTGTQVTALLNNFSSTLKGLAPASGGGATNFLRADGAWAVPPGLGPGGSSGQIEYNNSGSFGGFTMGGDATINTGTGTLTIAAQAVTYSKIQNESGHTILGNSAAGVGQIQELTLGTGLSFSGTSLIATYFTPNIQVFTSGSSLTYTTPTNGGNLPLYIRVRVVGGGGGGGAVNTNNGANGGDSSFASWTAIHGNGGINGASTSQNAVAGGTGGANGTGTQILRVAGGSGSGSATTDPSGTGGVSLLGGNGAGVGGSQAGTNAATNSGSGGSGASAGSGTGGSGGGAGEYVEFQITSPASSYVYTVGSGGNGGAAGVNAGGNGAAGIVIVEAFWQ